MEADMDLFHPIGTAKPTWHASLDCHYAYMNYRNRLKQRAAKLACCGLFPVLLAAVVHWSW